MSPVLISECFSSLQGEGSLAGVPSFFIRTSGCNLRCTWCDTPFASWKTEGRIYPVEELVELARNAGLHHVVLTGGEPLLQRDVAALTRSLQNEGFHLTVETAGTTAPDFSCDLLSVSPKTSNSDPQGKWKQRHRERRMDLEPLRELLGRFPNYQLKFVVRDGEDLPEIFSVLEDLGVEVSWKTQLMPEAADVETYSRRAPLVAALCREHGFRYTPRLHLRLFGGGRGV